MKKTILIFTVIINIVIGTVTESFARPRIPAEVKNYINTHYPNAKSIHWQRHDEVFIAHFISNKTETVVYLNEKGEFMNKLTEITAFNELPEDIRAKVNPKKMLLGEKLEGNEGEVFYIFEVTKPNGKIEELVFDAQGKEIENSLEEVVDNNSKQDETPKEGASDAVKE